MELSFLGNPQKEDDKLMSQGHEVICLDNPGAFTGGNKENIVKWIDNPKFECNRHE